MGEQATRRGHAASSWEGKAQQQLTFGMMIVRLSTTASCSAYRSWPSWAAMFCGVWGDGEGSGSLVDRRAPRTRCTLGHAGHAARAALF